MRKIQAIIVILFSVATCAVFADPDGNKFCEQSKFIKTVCNKKGCCEWFNNKCWYAEGWNGGKCDGKKVGQVLLPGVAGWVDGKIVWSDPPEAWGTKSCKKVTTVFGAAVCVTAEAWKARNKCDHIVNVYYQLLDNDADGVPDDPGVLAELVNGGYLLVVPHTEKGKVGQVPGQGVDQVTTSEEAVIGSCDSPTNRGATNNRSTWPNKVDTSKSGCTNQRDATFEEILHLITTAAAKLYPAIWGETFKSQAGKAINTANGDCGWGYTKNYKDPSGNKCTGQYAYDDKTCTLDCVVVEGIYWAAASYVGALYTLEFANDIKQEWLLATPDNSMPVLPAQVTNAKALQSSALYALVSDTTSDGHAWLPDIMTNGKYQGDPEGGNPVTPPVVAPVQPPGVHPVDPPTVTPVQPPVQPPVVSPKECPAGGKTNGEKFCEQSGFTQTECEKKCCCEW
eukprot:CAMPEP_0194266990 /NCGR_PEP_ID=MMETSP0169-20130528/1688_1 /TAXON_ID=218684 /ORGANISM="Corethron pennatum, Strain L29A3" /LENGTH=451 /DNA_ID=CAMNT_0039007779 /DNA_START=55 /DNA_END=1407 /DNA_ORIENTATION=+